MWPPREKKRLPPLKTMLSGLVTAITLAISITALYFSSLLQADDLRVVMDDGPALAASAFHEAFVQSDLVVTFINSGNQSAAITFTSVFFKNANQKKELTSCNEAPVLFLDYKMEPVVLKPGELAVRTLREPSENLLWQPNTAGGLRTSVAPFGIGDLVLTCIRFGVTTPDQESVELTLRKSIVKVPIVGSLEPFVTLNDFTKKKPVPLAKGSRIRFFQ